MGPYNKGYSILAFILGFPVLGNYHIYGGLRGYSWGSRVLGCTV